MNQLIMITDRHFTLLLEKGR